MVVPRADQEELEIEARIRLWIEAEMRERRIDQTTMAKRIGMSQGNLSKVLKGTRGIGLGPLSRIRRLVGVSWVRLMEEGPEGHTAPPPVPTAPQPPQRASSTAQPARRESGGRK